MLLPQQLQAILYHLLMGWVYGCTCTFVVSFCRGFRFAFTKAAVEIGFHLLFTSLMFYGLFYINSARTNAYLIAFFLLGAHIYYHLYLPVFLGAAAACKKRLAPWFLKLRLAKCRIVAIIRVPGKRRRRRKDAKKSRKHKKKKKEKASVSDDR